MSGDDRDGVDGPELVDEVMGALQKALGGLDLAGLKEAVREGLEQASQQLDEAVDPPGDNVVSLDEARHGSDGGSDPSVEVDERVSVQVLAGGLGQGRLRLSEGWQTVWSGPEASAYRLALSRGQLEVVVDDQTVAQLLPGQTCDVSGRSIRVRGTGSGQYRRL